MIYAINKQTKEHRKCTPKDIDSLVRGKVDINSDEFTVGGDSEGWIEWNGGDCPLPRHAKHQVKFRDNDIGYIDDEPQGWKWDHEHGRSDIIAYRPILYDKPEPGIDVTRLVTERQAPAWDGSGLPPVGTIVELSRNSAVSGFNKGDHVEVVAHRRAKASDVAIVWSDKIKRSTQLIPDIFRPIRSEEDKVVEEMQRIATISQVTPEALESITRALYRAGYRRT